MRKDAPRRDRAMRTSRRLSPPRRMMGIVAASLRALAFTPPVSLLGGLLTVPYTDAAVVVAHRHPLSVGAPFHAVRRGGCPIGVAQSDYPPRCGIPDAY